MAIYFLTDDAASLLAEFDKRIAQTEPEGKITTWEKGGNGLYTHKASDWAKQAWLKPTVGKEILRFNIIHPAGKKLRRKDYSYYHGHLIETFINHFHDRFTNAQATPNPSRKDKTAPASK